MKGRKFTVFIMLLLITGALSSCRMDLFGTLKSGGGATVTPRNGQWVAADGILNSEIVITFESSMDGSTPVLSGDLGPVSTAVWTTDNTLTITPAGWVPDMATLKSLTVDCTTTEGVAKTLNYSFRVAGSVRYVSTLGSPGGTGERNDPKDAINDAIGDINIIGTYPGVVLVAGGLYNQNAPIIQLDKNISIYGGWADNWSEWDPAKYTSELKPQTPITSQAISITSDLGSNDVVVEGFSVTVEPTTDNFIYTGILIDKAPVTLRNITVTSMDSTDISTSNMRGIHIQNGSTAKISDCTISLGGFNRGTIANNNNTNEGIYILDSSPDISNILINTGNTTGGTDLVTKGINIINSNGTINNSTITLGRNSDTSGLATNCINEGVSINSGSAPEIYQMTIHAGESNVPNGQTCGINIISSSPTVRNNPEINGGKSTLRADAIKITNASTANIIDNQKLTVDGCDSLAYGIRIDTTVSGCDPVISNNIIDGIIGTTACGIFVQAGSVPPKPTIDRNNIKNLSGSNTYGIEIRSDAEIHVSRNSITKCDSSYKAYGMYIVGVATAKLRIYNNVFAPEASGADYSHGINITGSNADIQNNTINGGSGNTACAIWLDIDGPVVNIQNNLIFTDFATSTSYCIYEESLTTNPYSLEYNYFFNSEYFYRDSVSGDKDLGFINNSTEITGITNFGNNNNTNLYSELDGSNNYKLLDILNPVDFPFTTAGLDGKSAGWVWDDWSDREGTPRTEIITTPPQLGWTVGAHEEE